MQACGVGSLTERKCTIPHNTEIDPIVLHGLIAYAESQAAGFETQADNMQGDGNSNWASADMLSSLWSDAVGSLRDMLVIQEGIRQARRGNFIVVD